MIKLIFVWSFLMLSDFSYFKYHEYKFFHNFKMLIISIIMKLRINLIYNIIATSIYISSPTAIDVVDTVINWKVYFLKICIVFI